MHFWTFEVQVRRFLSMKGFQMRQWDAQRAGLPLTLFKPPRACLKIARDAAARDFGFGQGGEAGASPKRAGPTEPTPDQDKRPAAGRFSRQGPSGFVAPQSKTHEGYSPSSRLASQPLARKQRPLEFSVRL